MHLDAPIGNFSGGGFYLHPETVNYGCVIFSSANPENYNKIKSFKLRYFYKNQNLKY